ncbi:MAG TPA: hypothetical protein VGK59_04385 [Ohtaekwangia sp.]
MFYFISDFMNVVQTTTLRHDLLLRLIEEDLKCRKLVNGLQALGFEACGSHPDLGMIIVACAGLDATSDVDLALYYDRAAAYHHQGYPAEAATQLGRILLAAGRE